MKIEEITRSESASAMVEALMARRNTPQPETVKLKEQYDPRGHRIFDTSERPDKIVRGENGEIERFEKVARIALPLQQVIVERAVAFLFGHPVLVSCAVDGDKQAAAFEAVKRTLSDNKIDSLNRRIARTVMRETEAAELWYPVEEKGFWERIARNERFSFVGEVPSQYKLRVALFSPGQGDRLYPVFDNYGNLTVFPGAILRCRTGWKRSILKRIRIARWRVSSARTGGLGS